jgi:hypothetical protein
MNYMSLNQSLLDKKLTTALSWPFTVKLLFLAKTGNVPEKRIMTRAYRRI